MGTPQPPLNQENAEKFIEYNEEAFRNKSINLNIITQKVYFKFEILFILQKDLI